MKIVTEDDVKYAFVLYSCSKAMKLSVWSVFADAEDKQYFHPCRSSKGLRADPSL